MNRFRDWWVDHPEVDYAVALLVAVSAWRMDVSFGEPGRSVLQAFGGLSTAMAGFGTLTVSLVASLNQPDHLRAALTQVGHRLARLVLQSIVTLWSASILFASAIAVSSSSPVQVALFALGASIALGALLRSVYLLLLLLRALMPLPAAAPPLVDAEIVLTDPDPEGYESKKVVPTRRTPADGKS